MILGIGTDLCDIRRVERSVVRFGDRFIDRVFTVAEREKAARRPSPCVIYAQCFAAKEACAKALGTGLRKGVFFRDIGVGNLASGKPFLTLRGGALRRLRAMTPDGMEARIDVTLSDEYPMAQAVVIVSADSMTANRDSK
ncbi:MAG: holo-ACP synthase [candidate division Zixibacteria bacterium]|nr:holo-ACP synthase [candidate division Zixibacteria bacterium]